VTLDGFIGTSKRENAWLVACNREEKEEKEEKKEAEEEEEEEAEEEEEEEEEEEIVKKGVVRKDFRAESVVR
jgi:hypothetical protein